VLYTTGLRRGEIVRLTMSDFDAAARVLHVRQTKFYKSRVVPLSMDASLEIDRYLLARQKLGAPCQGDAPLLAHCHGARFRGYTGAAFGLSMRKVMRMAGIRTSRGRAPRVHDLRFTFAVQALLRWYRAGVDVQAQLPALATYMGHASVVSTQVLPHLPAGHRRGGQRTVPYALRRMAVRRVSRGRWSVKRPLPTSFAVALRAFFSQHLPLTRGLSPQTILSYRDTFLLLLRFLAGRHHCGVVDLGMDHLTAEHVLAFLEHLETDRHNSVATRNARLAAIHAFARFAATRDPERVEACQRLLALPTKRGPARAVDYLEADEIRAMLDAIPRQGRHHVRDHALLLTLFNTGARVQELLDIRAPDVQLERPTCVRLRGKGRKERLCPLWPETVDALRALPGMTSRAAGSMTPLFPNHRGEPLTRFGVRYILRRYAERARTTAPSLATKRVHPHTYRHAAAVHLLRAGVDLVTISHWLGHASVETTNRYAAVDLETKREALKRAGPITGTAEHAVTVWRADASVLEWLKDSDGHPLMWSGFLGNTAGCSSGSIHST
jgi:integrase/recombinase XerD